MRRFFLGQATVVAVVCFLAGAAAAQDVKSAGGGLDLSSFVGTWTVAPNGDCTRSLYSWTVRGNEFQFLGPNGSVDVERVVTLRADGFVAVTISSPSNPPGTNWDFRLVAPGTFRVQNLSTGRGFELRRCGGEPAARTAPGPVPARPEDRSVWNSHSDAQGGSIAYGVPETDNVGFQMNCGADRRTLSISVPSPVLPIGRRVRVTVTAGGTATSFDAVYEEGMGGYVYGTLPAGHPIVALLRSGERALRVQVAGMSYPVPLTGIADHARRFEAACRGG